MTTICLRRPRHLAIASVLKRLTGRVCNNCTILHYVAKATVITSPYGRLALLTRYCVVPCSAANEKGKEKKWFGLKTGPGIENTLYYYVDINKEHILKGSGTSIPDMYKTEIWKMWHKELKSEHELFLGQQVVLFLKGNTFEPVSLPEYIQQIFNPEMLTEIEEFVKDPKN